MNEAWVVRISGWNYSGVGIYETRGEEDARALQRLSFSAFESGGRVDCVEVERKFADDPNRASWYSRDKLLKVYSRNVEARLEPLIDTRDRIEKMR